MKELRTVVVFWSEAFNTCEPRPYFINECCFGDDLARWLIARMRANGVETDDEPGQEDFGWYFGYRTADGAYLFVLGHRPDEAVFNWIGWVERDCGFFAGLFGRARRIAQSGLDALHAALDGAAELRDVAWHRRSDFDRGDETQGAERPTS
jgi:hypothetical protein